MGTKGKKIIIVVGIMFLAAMLCGFGFLQKKDDEYRTIRVYKIEGSAIVDRDGVGSIDAYEGMMMQSGDIVKTGKESCLYFKMDEDKFALLEPESTVRMETSGTSSDSRTTFYLESGSLVSRLDSKLSPDSVYEVNTPNSTMAVRGTIFRIEVVYDENGVYYTNVYVFDGTVECTLIFADGSVDEETKQVQNGMMIRVRRDNTTSEYILDNGTVDYRQLPVEVLRFLKDAVEEGNELPVSKEELEAAIAEIEKSSHEHSGGTATCISPAVCTSEDCGQIYGEKNPANHIGGIEIRNKKDATCVESGYTGDTYCLGCGKMIQAGGFTGINANIHTGGTKVRKKVEATCASAGYTGDIYCRGCGEKLQSGKKIKKDASNHTGGTKVRKKVEATCASAGYTGDTYCRGCGEKLQSGKKIKKDASNHTGGTTVRDSIEATCASAGYTGDTYCNGCGKMIQAGSETEIDASNHVGEVEIQNSIVADCSKTGYSGDTYCLSCGKMIQAGSEIAKDASNHVGGTEIRNSFSPSCCSTGYSGDVFCLGCNTMLEEGRVIAATGNHPAAVCGVPGHHAHDGLDHTPAYCNVEGHFNCDGRNHEDKKCIGYNDSSNPDVAS